MSNEILLLISVDTEEDNWRPTRDEITLENVRQLPRLHRFLRDRGVRPTYFVDYPVAAAPWSAGLLRDLAKEEGVEIGAHLHPWNTPPLDEPLSAANTMLLNLPAVLQRRKLETLQGALWRATGSAPRSFRAGRFGLGRETVTQLIDAGFDVDSSVTPFFHWREDARGADFDGAPVHCYRLDGRGDVRKPVASGGLREVPLSCGFTRFSTARGASVYRALERSSPPFLPLPKLASRSRWLRRVLASPETHSVRDLLSVARALVGEGASYLHFYCHSPSLVPGLTPFVRNGSELERFYGRIGDLLLGLSSIAPMLPVTVGECAERLCA